MEINANQKILGAQEGALVGQNERVDELNGRMIDRQFPDSALKPNIDMRPIQTKQILFSVLDCHPKSELKANEFSDYTLSNFNPGSDRAPVSGYFSNVDLENQLRNQRFANQHGAPQGVYIPSSTSDLYKTEVVSRPSAQPHPLLFKNPEINTPSYQRAMHSSIGNDKLFNHTRTQLRNL
jgi:hypothetical protein